MIPKSAQDKARRLIDLNRYPVAHLKSVVWRWFLNTTSSGEYLFERAANNLVLYTNINKITAFYRIFREVRGRKKTISPRIRKIAIILHLYTRNIFSKDENFAFDRLKENMLLSRNSIALRLIKMARMRQRKLIGYWFKNTVKQSYSGKEK